VTIEDAVQRFAEAAAVVHPSGEGRWRFSASSGGGQWFERPTGDRDNGYEFFRTWMNLVVANDNQPLLVEAVIRPGSDYEVTIGGSQAARQPGRLIADEDYRLPGHPLPGLPRPAAAAPSDRPTDPATLAAVTDLFTEFIARFVEIRRAQPEFEPGLGEEEIAAAEAQMGVRLPEDLRALYRLIHHDPESGLLGRWSILPLDYVVDSYLEFQPGSYGWYDDPLHDDHVVFETVPFGHVRRLSRSDWWITVASDFGMNYGFVDVDPAADGTPGQILAYGRDIYGPFDYLGSSVLARLRRSVESLRAYEPQTTDDPDDEFDDDWPPFNMDDERPIGAHEQRIVLDGRSLADAIGDLAEPGNVQELLVLATTGVRDRGPVDLDGLTGLPRLRELKIMRASTLTGRLSADLPVEALRIDGDYADLAGLGGHPTLWSLTLGDGLHCDTALLADIPELIWLRLGDVPTDITPVAGLAGLRVLIAVPAAWQQLRDTDAFPPNLAAAKYGQRTPVIDDIAAWTEWAAPRMPGLPAVTAPRTIRGLLGTETR
jgi:cell wall assembly regulator SMI1